MEILVILGFLVWIYLSFLLAASRAWWLTGTLPGIGGMVVLATLPDAHGDVGAALARGASALAAIALFAVAVITLVLAGRARSRALRRSWSQAVEPTGAAPLPVATLRSE